MVFRFDNIVHIYKIKAPMRSGGSKEIEKERKIQNCLLLVSILSILQCTASHFYKSLTLNLNKLKHVTIN